MVKPDWHGPRNSIGVTKVEMWTAYTVQGQACFICQVKMIDQRKCPDDPCHAHLPYLGDPPEIDGLSRITLSQRPEAGHRAVQLRMPRFRLGTCRPNRAVVECDARHLGNPHTSARLIDGVPRAVHPSCGGAFTNISRTHGDEERAIQELRARAGVRATCQLLARADTDTDSATAPLHVNPVDNGEKAQPESATNTPQKSATPRLHHSVLHHSVTPWLLKNSTPRELARVRVAAMVHRRWPELERASRRLNCSPFLLAALIEAHLLPKGITMTTHQHNELRALALIDHEIRAIDRHIDSETKHLQEIETRAAHLRASIKKAREDRDALACERRYLQPLARDTLHGEHPTQN